MLLHCVMFAGRPVRGLQLLKGGFSPATDETSFIRGTAVQSLQPGLPLVRHEAGADGNFVMPRSRELAPGLPRSKRLRATQGEWNTGSPQGTGDYVLLDSMDLSVQEEQSV